MEVPPAGITEITEHVRLALLRFSARGHNKHTQRDNLHTHTVTHRHRQGTGKAQAQAQAQAQAHKHTEAHCIAA